MNKSFWMSRDAGCPTDGDMNYDASSRTEPKRAYEWFMDISELELFRNKKQAIEAVSSRPLLGIPNDSISPWGNASNFVSGQFTDFPFGSETLRTFNLIDRSTPTVGTENLHMERKCSGDQFGSDSSVALSMSHAIQDPGSFLNCGAIRKLQVNKVGDPENGMPVSLRHSYDRRESNPNSTLGTYNKTDSIISLGPTCNSEEENTISMGSAFNKSDDLFILMGHTFNKGDSNFMLMGHDYNKVDDNVPSMGQPHHKGNRGFISISHLNEKEHGNLISACPAYNKGHENIISMSSSYNKASDNFVSIGPSDDKGDDNITLMCSAPGKADTMIAQMGTTYDKGNSDILSMGHNCNKGESSTISFGGFQDDNGKNLCDGIISGYDLLVSQPLAQTSKAPCQGDSSERDSGPAGSVALGATSKTDSFAKSKEAKTKEKKAPKKVPPNSFPSNVKSLLSTGILDGVPVKYTSWSRVHNLRGVIRGTGYLCGCKDCNFNTVLNAYEFERHAGCNTKHPNNHIYFENGKTIYVVVQELKSTPQEMLFETIQNVTGSPINQSNFRIWKVSHEAATRELQRIYGKDEAILPS